jgi:hypothetical protein
MSTPVRRKKDVRKLIGRYALDFATVGGQAPAVAARRTRGGAPLAAEPPNPALMRLQALAERDAPVAATTRARGAAAPVDAARANWTPLGPLAVPGGQTYGGARVLISGRVTAIAPHPTDGNVIYIGSSRGGVWRTGDGGNTWAALTDDAPSLAIGALAISASNPLVLYAGTGEGNVQLYSTAYPTSSAPGVYLGVGVLRSVDGGATWAHHAAALLANRSFYRIAVDRGNANRAFAATSAGLARTTNGTTWALLAGGGLPALAGSVIACCDVLIDRSDATGNTVYAAFFGSGIYRSSNAQAASPTFTKLVTGLPASASVSRISLHQSASNPARKVALVAGSNDAFNGLYRTSNAAGTTWELCTSSATIELYGAFTNDVNVDPTSENLVYVTGVELYKCQRNATTGVWAVSNIGGNIHPDSHTLGFHPTQNQTIYSGNDGGFFVSRDAGATWDDSPNEGLCLLQYEAIDNHGSSDAVVQGGTQDNGTQQYRNSPVHYHSADGDGGYCAVSKTNGNRVMHAYYGNTPQRSALAGQFGSYAAVQAGLNGNGLFYPPAAISPSSERVAWATTVINIDDAMGTGGWPGAGVSLPGPAEPISAISFTNASLIYCATIHGRVYRLDFNSSTGTWAVRSMHAAPLPIGPWIWDVHSLPGNDNVIVVCFSGFGLAQHVWRGTVPASGAATWVAVSAGLPDVPMYALAFASAAEWYVGTDIGVFRSTNSGVSWLNWSQGLPNTAIYDLRLRPGSTLLRAGTHGRGLWELRTDLAVQPTVDLFVRDHIMDGGRGSASAPTSAPVSAAWDDATRQIALNDPCWWWHCADIKSDAPPAWQLTPAQRNYFHFETRLVHENPEKGNANRIYVQVHNRGPLAAANVTVKIMVAAASAGLPDLPADFWTTWPNSAGNAHWTPVGVPQTIATLEALRPTVLQWDWTPDPAADTHSCMLVVVDSPSDAIPAATKTVFDIAQLVTTEKRTGLKNLHLVNLLPDALRPLPFYLHAGRKLAGAYLLRVPALAARELGLSMLLSQKLSEKLAAGEMPKGLKVAPLPARDLAAIKKYWLGVELRSEASWEALVKALDVTRQYSVDARSQGVDVPVAIRRGGREGLLLLARSGKLTPAMQASWTVQQRSARGEVVGGSTFVFRAAKR